MLILQSPSSPAQKSAIITLSRPTRREELLRGCHNRRAIYVSNEIITDVHLAATLMTRYTHKCQLRNWKVVRELLHTMLSPNHAQSIHAGFRPGE